MYNNQYHFLKERKEFAITAWDVLLKQAKNCEKDTTFDHSSTITRKGNMKTSQMVQLLLPAFFIHFFFICPEHLGNICLHFNIVKIYFHGVPILACKIPELWRWKMWDQNFVPLESGNMPIKETKNQVLLCLLSHK